MTALGQSFFFFDRKCDSLLLHTHCTLHSDGTSRIYLRWIWVLRTWEPRDMPATLQAWPDIGLMASLLHISKIRKHDDLLFAKSPNGFSPNVYVVTLHRLFFASARRLIERQPKEPTPQNRIPIPMSKASHASTSGPSQPMQHRSKPKPRLQGPQLHALSHSRSGSLPVPTKPLIPTP
jgi:hypothetical protein